MKSVKKYDVIDFLLLKDYKKYYVLFVLKSSKFLRDYFFLFVFMNINQLRKRSTFSSDKVNYFFFTEYIYEEESVFIKG